jgi:hypothetical protein
VPHYISASPNPKVAHSLLSRLNTIFNLGLELNELDRAGRRFERQVNEALAHNPEVAQYVKQLEARDEEGETGTETEEASIQRPESGGGGGELPRGEDIVRQLEEFLRERAADKDDGANDPPASS